MQNSVLFVEAV